MRNGGRERKDHKTSWKRVRKKRDFLRDLLGNNFNVDNAAKRGFRRDPIPYPTVRSKNKIPKHILLSPQLGCHRMDNTKQGSQDSTVEQLIISYNEAFKFQEKLNVCDSNVILSVHAKKLMHVKYTRIKIILYSSKVTSHVF